MKIYISKNVAAFVFLVYLIWEMKITMKRISKLDEKCEVEGKLEDKLPNISFPIKIIIYLIFMLFLYCFVEIY